MQFGVFLDMKQCRPWILWLSGGDIRSRIIVLHQLQFVNLFPNNSVVYDLARPSDTRLPPSPLFFINHFASILFRPLSWEDDFGHSACVPRASWNNLPDPDRPAVGNRLHGSSSFQNPNAAFSDVAPGYDTPDIPRLVLRLPEGHSRAGEISMQLREHVMLLT